MSKVVIGFSAPIKRKIGAEAIKLWMGTDFSHVFLQIYSKYTEQTLIYQASHGYVHLITAENFAKENKVIAQFDLQISDEKLKNTIKNAQQLLGRPYGYLGLLRLVLHKLGTPIIGDGTKTFHCSELIATLFPELVTIDADFAEPVDLYRQLMQGECKI